MKEDVMSCHAPWVARNDREGNVVVNLPVILLGVLVSSNQHDTVTTHKEIVLFIFVFSCNFSSPLPRRFRFGGDYECLRGKRRGRGGSGGEGSLFPTTLEGHTRQRRAFEGAFLAGCMESCFSTL